MRIPDDEVIHDFYQSGPLDAAEPSTRNLPPASYWTMGFEEGGKLDESLSYISYPRHTRTQEMYKKTSGVVEREKSPMSRESGE